MSFIPHSINHINSNRTSLFYYFTYVLPCSPFPTFNLTKPQLLLWSYIFPHLSLRAEPENWTWKLNLEAEPDSWTESEAWKLNLKAQPAGRTWKPNLKAEPESWTYQLSLQDEVTWPFLAYLEALMHLKLRNQSMVTNGRTNARTNEGKVALLKLLSQLKIYHL